MALKFYSDQALTQEITSLTTQHANTGMAVERRIFIANTGADAAQMRAENVQATVIDNSGSSEVAWVQFAPDNAGTAGAYGAGGAALVMANISDQNVAKPLWVKITNTSVPDAINKTDLQLKVLFKKFAV